MKKIVMAFSLALVCVMGLNANAQSLITWQASQDIFQGVGNETGPSAQSFIDTTGTSLLAINATNDDAVPDATVNGVAF